MEGAHVVIVDKIESGKNLVEGRIRVGSRTHVVSFRSELELSDAAPDAFLLLALPAAMRHGGRLIIDAPVSRRLLSQIPAIQDIYRCWDSKLRAVDVEASTRTPDYRPRPPSQYREAIAFTGGVDSFYSALRHPETSLVFVYGLDIPLDNRDLRRKVSERLAWAAAELNRPLLEIETNLRSFSDRDLPWNLAFGGALSACSLLLSEHLAVFGIPAGQSYEFLQPDGAHPVLNPLFSTEEVAIHATGCEARRVEKVEAIASHPVVQGALRVCWENRGNTYNCGVCEKCLRTMAALEIFGALSQCSTFHVPLDYGRLGRTVASDPALDMFTQQNLDFARTRGASPELIESLERSMDPRRVSVFRPLRKAVPGKFNDWSYRIFHRTGKSGLNHVE